MRENKIQDVENFLARIGYDITHYENGKDGSMTIKIIERNWPEYVSMGSGTLKFDFVGDLAFSVGFEKGLSLAVPNLFRKMNGMTPRYEVVLRKVVNSEEE